MSMAAQFVFPQRLLGKRVLIRGQFGRSHEFMRLKLAAMAEAHEARVVSKLDGSVDYVVVPNVAAGETIARKVELLNQSGARIRLIDGESFRKLLELTKEEVVALIRNGGARGAEILRKALNHPADWYYLCQRRQATFSIDNQRFDGADLSEFSFNEVTFTRCSFVGACCREATFSSATQCDFSGADATGATFGDVAGSRFAGARMEGMRLEGAMDGADFTSAILDGARLNEGLYAYSKAQGRMAGVILSRASLRDAQVFGSYEAPDFEGADLSAAILAGSFANGNFRGANLRDARFIGCELPQADFSGASLSGVNLAEADLTGSTVDDADFADANLLGAELDGVDLSKARNLGPDPHARIGPALRELESVVADSDRVQIRFVVRHADGTDIDEGAEVGIDTDGLRCGWGLRLSQPISRGYRFGVTTNPSISEAMLQLAAMTRPRQVRYETLEVEGIKAPRRGKALWELVLRSIAEAFAQPPGDRRELAKASQAYRNRTTAETMQATQVRAAQEDPQRQAGAGQGGDGGDLHQVQRR
jgi:uncharacterized protein YjbI with pentapeptide repeats